ncbi:unnamed protein product [Chondrus crispus]|uniref:Uncharacterized protein n=1 Tax=Chondrus crispus TaxID=2769 RepID=R7QV63_CHOCR|nr:unnamed protein product [Chondrus crispus]CDF41245.1 unnamed protein product [Chondrus crispus]|eukprot:XP_005711539.1 unnamed protein product [Chondrus crispus]
MARTKQTAAKSTGGKRPRKQLALKAACVASRSHLIFALSSRTGVTKVSKTGSIFHIWVASGHRRYAVTEQEFKILLGDHITALLYRKQDEEFSLEEIWRLGLTESLSDTNQYCIIGDGEWNIESIYLDVDNTYYGVDAATNLPHRILLYTLAISGTGNSTTHKIVDDLFQFGGRDRISGFLSIDRFCTDQKGRSLKMIHGRSRAVNPRTPIYRVSTHGTVRFRDNSDMCISAAVCNGLQLLGSLNLAVKYWDLLVRNSLFFERTGSPSRRIRDFHDAAKHLNQDEVTLRGSGLRSPSLGLLLRLDPGVYVATLEVLPYITHSICVSTIHSIVLDFMEWFPLRFCAGAVKACVGADGILVGVSELRQVLVVTPSKKKRSRIGRVSSRRAHKKAAIRGSGSSIQH